ncbi:hypothetical protein C8035_v007556 [Colletotrichum spinosum]|uniref:GPI anchored protein n=1 Tax=Colletotrichum spinosum TaxID=1347390 RepID=A0A4R8PSU3_9PEZI|nr:hypothetical protein C8035_v007556 [Colletotrichum spinosum]
MKATQILSILGFSAVAMAQSLAPSPTESWHCEGPRESGTSLAASVTAAPSGTTLSSAVVVTTTATEDHDHDHDEDDHDHSGTGVLPPSPTESVGCLAHGDHWHCDGPVSTTSESGAAVTTTVATTAAAGTNAGNSASPSSTSVPAGAGRAGFGAAAIVAALMAL